MTYEALGGQIGALTALLEDMRRAGFATPQQIQNVYTGGGMFVHGNATAGRDVIGRDQINHYNLAYKRDTLHQLRAIPETFTGRAAEIAAILDHVKTRAATGAAVTITSSLAGMGGVGKTELANVVAHALSADYPDVQLVLELGANSAQPRTVSQVLTALLQQFEPDARLPEAEADLRALYLNALANKRGIVIIDDAGSAAQVKALLPPPGCVALVTSRQALSVGERLALNVLPRSEAVALLRRYRAKLSDAVADTIAALCADLPVALTVAGGFLAVYEAVSSETYAKKLKSARLDALADETASVRRVFAASYEALTPALRAAWCALSVMPADFDRTAGAAVAQFDAEALPSPLDELVRLSLIEREAVAERHRWHDLLREFAAEQASADGLQAARGRHSAWSIMVARQANALFYKGNAGVVAAARLFDGERAHLDAAFAFLTQPGNAMPARERAEAVCELVDAVHLIGALRFHPREHIRWSEAHVTAAREIGDPRHEQAALDNLGLAHNDLGHARQAIEFFEQALDIAQAISDRRGQAGAWINLGLAYFSLGDFRQAIAYSEQALMIVREIGDRRSEGKALGILGTAYIRLGNAHQAITHYEHALTIFRQTHDRHGESTTLGNIGLANSHLGRAHQAIEFYEQQLVITRQIGDRRGEAEASWNLGNEHARQGDLARAIELMQVLVTYLQEIGHTDAAQAAAQVADLRKKIGGK